MPRDTTPGSAGSQRTLAPCPEGQEAGSRAEARDGAQARELEGTLPVAARAWTPAKDQSYFLHRLTQAQLARTLFPVGELAKTEVRRIAAEIGLPNAKPRRTATGICFIGERPFREFLNRYLAHAPGPIRDDRGRTLGEHVGLSFYTLGQRKGIGIGGVKESGAARGAAGSPTGGPGDHAPWFVARKEMASNTLYVVQGHEHPWLQSTRLDADDASWVAGRPPPPGALAAKTRYRQSDAACSLAPEASKRFCLSSLRRSGP